MFQQISAKISKAVESIIDKANKKKSRKKNKETKKGSETKLQGILKKKLIQTAPLCKQASNPLFAKELNDSDNEFIPVDLRDPKDLFLFFKVHKLTDEEMIVSAKNVVEEKYSMIKVVPIESLHSLKNVLREVTFLSKNVHHNVINFQRSFVDDCSVWIEMEQTITKLSDIIDKYSFSEDQIASICKDILSGLESIHKAGIIHRALSSKNIFVTYEGHLKIAEFGKACEQTKARDSVVLDAMQTAPETLYGKHTPKLDIWSLGTMILEMKHTNSEEKWSTEFQDFLKMCLYKDPEMRPSASELLMHPFIQQVKERASSFLCEMI